MIGLDGLINMKTKTFINSNQALSFKQIVSMILQVFSAIPVSLYTVTSGYLQNGLRLSAISHLYLSISIGNLFEYKELRQ